MPRHVLQTITLAALLVATVFVTHKFVRYVLRVDGGYSEWSMFSECTRSCGEGTRFRTRRCSNPPPSFGGLNCSILGEDQQTFKCNTLPCPVDGGYGPWSDYGECSVTCGGGQQSRERKCNSPEPSFGGKTCEQLELGPSSETRSCGQEPCPVDGGFGPWSEYGECSATCGNGVQKRERKCDSPEPQHGGKPCEGPNEEISSCEQKACPVDGGYTEWSEFGPCSVTCGGGTQSRNRNCSNPEPSNGGKNCDDLGPSMETQECNTAPCAAKISPANSKETKQDNQGGGKEKN